MALRGSSSCTQAVANAVVVAEASGGRVQEAQVQVGGVLPLPVRPKLQGTALRRTRSRKPVKARASAEEAGVVEQSAIAQVGDEIAAASGEILDVVDAAIEDGPAAMRVRRSAGKANSRTSRRRALVMCLALGMVRPCASDVASNLQSGSDLRRTASAMPALRRTESSSFKVRSTLVSQVSLATTLKQTNLLGEQEDLQKLTTLQ